MAHHLQAKHLLTCKCVNEQQHFKPKTQHEIHTKSCVAMNLHENIKNVQ
jgi:hypothetical protein